jgi:hypothetical protein
MNSYKIALEKAGQPQLIEKFKQMGVKYANEVNVMIQNDPNLLEEMGVKDVVIKGKIKHEMDLEWGKMIGVCVGVPTALFILVIIYFYFSLL